MLFEKWMLYALSAAMLWGASYAASGPVLRMGMTPLVFYFFYSLVGIVIALILLLVQGKIGMLPAQLFGLGPNAGWLLFSLLAASLGGVMTYLAIGEKNATLACLIEISYPMFVILFTWVFFQEVELNVMTGLGALLVIGGVSLILFHSHANK